MVSRVNESGKPIRQYCITDEVQEIPSLDHPPNQCGRYIFYSSPKPVSTIIPGYRNHVSKPRGVHDYYNMMWDPHVYRGDSSKAFAEAERGRCEMEARKAARRRKLRNILVSPTKKMGGINRPGTPSHFSDRKKNVNTQTVKYLEEFGEEPKAFDGNTQTDIISDVQAQLVFKPVKTGKDAETQLDPSELFNFDKEVLPIVDVLIVKVLEQAILETMEEQELSSLKQQENAQEETRRGELSRLNRLRDRQQEVRRQNEEIAVEGKDDEMKAVVLEKTIGAACCAKSYIGGMLNKMLSQFRREGYLSASALDEGITQSFLPWLNGEVAKSTDDLYQSYNLLEDIVKNVVLTREANIVNDVVTGPASPMEYDGEDGLEV